MLHRFPKDVVHQLEQLSGGSRPAEEFWDLHQNDFAADAADKTAHNRSGDEVGEASRPQQCEQQEPQGDHQGDHRHEGHGFLGSTGDSEGGEHSPYQCGRCGVHAKDELRRGGAQAEKENRQNRSVQSVDGRQSGNLGIAHGYRDGYQRNNDSRRNIFPEIHPVVVFQKHIRLLFGFFHSFFRVRAIRQSSF